MHHKNNHGGLEFVHLETNLSKNFSTAPNYLLNL